MGLILLLIVLFFVFGGIGHYGVRQNWYGPGVGYGGGFGLLILVIILIFLFRGVT